MQIYSIMQAPKKFTKANVITFLPRDKLMVTRMISTADKQDKYPPKNASPKVTPKHTKKHTKKHAKKHTKYSKNDEDKVIALSTSAKALEKKVTSLSQKLDDNVSTYNTTFTTNMKNVTEKFNIFNQQMSDSASVCNANVKIVNDKLQMVVQQCNTVTNMSNALDSKMANVDDKLSANNSTFDAKVLSVSDKINQLTNHIMTVHDTIANNQTTNEIIIDNILPNNTLLVDTVSCLAMGSMIYINNAFKTFTLLLESVSGVITFSEPYDATKYNITGIISIFNASIGAIYDGVVYVSNGEVQYTLSNDPIVPLNVQFEGILHIYLKVIPK
jgi:hypothetical protein